MRAIPLLLALSLLSPPLAADDNERIIGEWLAKQGEVKTWVADVTQTRKLRSLTRPLESQGQVWFAQPNRFRWQLGSPPRTIAVRTADQLLVAYPRLRQLEKYPMTGELDESWKQVLALLEVGFPSDPETFHASYEVLSVTAADDRWHLELRPAAKQARRLIERVRLELAGSGFELAATELEFPDGSTMRNDFSGHRINPELDASVFELDTSGYEVANPLDGPR